MDIEKTIKEELEEIITKMGFKIKIEVTETSPSIYYAHIKTEDDPSLLIGRYAQTLRSIQKILQTILYKKVGEKIRVIVDVNDYRESQKERLQSIAKNTAEKVQTLGKPLYLKSFSSYERRIIHEFITEKYLDLSSYSQDDMGGRLLFIAPKEAKIGQESIKEEKQISEKEE